MKPAMIASFVFLSLMVLVPFNNCSDSEERSLFGPIARGIEEIFETRAASKPNYLKNALKSIKFPPLLLLRDDSRDFKSSVICFLCEQLATTAIAARRQGVDRKIFMQILEFLCASLRIASPRVCRGVLELNIDHFLYIVDHRRDITAERVCGIVFQNHGCPSDNTEWSIKLPEGNRETPPHPNSDKSIKILHITDVHYDPVYRVNGNAKCAEPICCQYDQKDPSTDEDSCGYWSDYRLADLPWHTVEEIIKQTKTHQDIDFVYFTGDIVSHRVWQTSVANNTASISKFYTYLNEQFSDVPKYMVLGNHEPHPLNVWVSKGVSERKFSNEWLFNLCSQMWTNDLVAKETIRFGGYYTALVPNHPKLRVVVINSNLGYIYNWWLIFHDVDPYNQLQWLVDTLKQAEDNGEMVHLLSHVPSGGSDVHRTWSREYKRIIERFSSTITGHFNGHTHRDQFYVYYNSTNYTQPVGAAFNGGSMTTYDKTNPNYKIFSVDPTTYQILDFETWAFNLTQANQKESRPDWHKLYSFREAFEVENLLPIQVDKVTQKLADDPKYLDKYFRYTVNEGDLGMNARNHFYVKL